MEINIKDKALETEKMHKEIKKETIHGPIRTKNLETLI